MDQPENRLALIELLGRDGHVLRSVDVHRWPVSVGRALGNTVVLDDPHVAALHATLAPEDETGQLYLNAAASINGVRVDQQRLQPGERAAIAPKGALLQFGQSRLRLRLPSEHLADERMLAVAPQLGPLALVGLIGALMAMWAASQWLSFDPNTPLSRWLPILLGWPAVLLFWCGAWALGSKLFQQRFEFMAHLAIALPWMAGLQLLDMVLPQLFAALDWPLAWHLSPLLLAVGGVLLLRAHFRLVLPNQARAIAVVLAALLAVSVGLSWMQNERMFDSPFASPYMSALPMPAMRWHRVQDNAEGLIKGMTALRDPLQARVAKAKDDEPGGEAESESDD
jgi:pSer/pThr/pTyr-binding forkhead associated (FHA) protein